MSYGLQSQRKRQKVKNVPTLKVTKVKKVMKMVKFMYQFDLLMETNGVNEADQKSYLLESVHPDVVHCLLVKGVEVSSPGEMMALVTRSYDLVVGTFDVFWDLFQVLFSGFISGSEGWGVQVGVGFLSMF